MTPPTYTEVQATYDGRIYRMRGHIDPAGAFVCGHFHLLNAHGKWVPTPNKHAARFIRTLLLNKLRPLHILSRKEHVDKLNAMLAARRAAQRVYHK